MALDLSALGVFKEKQDSRITPTKSGKGSWVHPQLRGRNVRNGVSSLERMRIKSSSRVEDIKPERNTQKEETQKPASKMDRLELDIATLDDFITAFDANKKNASALFGLLSKEFAPIASIIANKYYSPKYETAVESMNKVITAMTTKLFATALMTVVKDNMIDDFDDVKTDIASLITIALDSSSAKMRDDTISIYVEIVSEYIWPLEIKDLMTSIGVDEDTAIDIVLAVPTFGKKMTELQLKNAAPRFWAIITDHAENMINTMDAENQKRLFYYIFPDIDRQSLKVVGKCLSYEMIEQTNDYAMALYKEYQRALYEMLDDNDIADIKYTLKFLVGEMTRNKELHRDAPIVFNTNTALDYENVRKAIVDLVAEDETAKNFLSQ